MQLRIIEHRKTVQSWNHVHRAVYVDIDVALHPLHLASSSGYEASEVREEMCENGNEWPSEICERWQHI